MHASIGGYEVFEFAVIAALVVYSLWRVAGRLAPKLRTRAVTTASSWMTRPARPSWLARLGRRIAPATVESASCGSGCGSCGGCEPKAPDRVETKTVAWHRPR